jgi:probable addiction module antidote protein
MPAGRITKKGTHMARPVRETHNEQLRDPEMAAQYLNAALEDGNSAVILMALRQVADAQENGVSGLAARASLGRESMYKILSSKGNPKLSSFTKIIESLGLHLKVEA